MRHFPTAVLTAALVVIAFAATSVPAAASPADEYRAAMKPFAHDLARWSGNVNAAAEAAVVKPELSCGTDLAELGRIGGWMADDLKGTAQLAPRPLASAHADLTVAVERMGRAAASACGQPDEAARVIRGEVENFNTALTKIRNFTDGRFHRGRPGLTPDLPGSEG
ncbi:MAG: hypothetical protein ACE5EL_07100 [Anaerolineae bacterium]